MDAAGGPRTIIATMSRVDRATKKALRERERKAREGVKRSTAPVLAARYEDLFEQLTRAHCVKYERRNWREIIETGPVEPAVRANALEKKARHALANYRPGVIDGLLGLQADRRRALAGKVLEAAKKDAELFAQAKRNAELHNLDLGLAEAVMALDFGAIEAALKAHLPVAELAPILEGLGIDMPAPGKLVVHLDVLELDAMPDESVGLSDNGRSVHAYLSLAARREMHLTNVCAAVLRVGVEVMSVVPIDKIELLARGFLPGRTRDGLEQHPILHVRLSHEALRAMDLRRLEPVSAISALGARISWEIERGFGPIPIDDLKLTPPPKPQPSAAPA